MVAAVVGSGIMGERLAGGNMGLALLANTAATGTALAVLVLTFSPLSGAHFTVCDSANERCPLFPGQTMRLHWRFDDPTQAQGTEAERLDAFRRVRDQIRARLQTWLDAAGRPPCR